MKLGLAFKWIWFFGVIGVMGWFLVNVQMKLWEACSNLF